MIDAGRASVRAAADYRQTWTLAFRDRAVEARYRGSIRDMRVWHRILWSVVLVLFIALAFVDPYTAGSAENLRVISRIRVGLAIPLFAITTGFGFLARPVFARYRQAMTAFGVVSGLGTLSLMAALVPAPELLQTSGNPMSISVCVFGICIWTAMLRLDTMVPAAILGLATLPLVLVSRRFPAFDTVDVRFWYGTSAIIGVLVARQFEYSWRGAFVASEALEQERSRSEALLLNVLPAPIAQRLKLGEGRIADRFEEATVLFGDLAGFTELSSVMSPEALVAKLDEVFSAFDDVAAQHGLEKIKTIGDAYMVVGGVPTPRDDHAEVVVQMALEMLRFVDALPPVEGRRLRMRIGVHSGPLVAGVIGKRKFAFDLWGDTVNVSSRMESHGVVGEVQLSDATRERLHDRFPLVARGTIHVKGKGEMTAWLVDRKTCGGSAAS